jgi:Ca2+-binding EF-hand superfamily protein
MTSISGYSAYTSTSSYFRTQSRTAADETSTDASQSTKLEDLFSTIDSDSDGSITKDELKSFGDKLAAQMQSTLLSAQETGGAQGAFGPPPPPPGGGKSVEEMFSDIDSDGDGSVSADELKSFGEAKASRAKEAAAEAFETADSDGDGQLSKSEFEAFGEALRAQRGAQAYGQAQSLTQPDFASWYSNSNSSSSDTSSDSDDIQRRLLSILMQA